MSQSLSHFRKIFFIWSPIKLESWIKMFRVEKHRRILPFCLWKANTNTPVKISRVGKDRKLLLLRYRVSVSVRQRELRGWTVATAAQGSMLHNCPFENGEDGKFYVLYILPQFLKMSLTTQILCTTILCYPGISCYYKGRFSSSPWENCQQQSELHIFLLIIS